MSSPRKKRGRNTGCFHNGFEPRRRRGFTRAECQKDYYQSTKAKMHQRSPDAFAWFHAAEYQQFKRAKDTGYTPLV